ncbi:hypothetical protein [Pseudomonas sp. MONT-RG-20F-20-E-7-02]|uniref:hypothetical protein n=1 Tax=Pseudomonas sp. MONT-RG-20F-20-E-7-02 TaxID=2914979 RepID=UPI001F59AFD8|nr:hypothetical protein [Pseudomonas sp. MONT-RG-20F-20-E-7-02]
MSPEQRAIIAAAAKDGVSPIERDARLIVHGMVNATRDQMRKYQVGYDKMGEQQQDAVLADLTAAYNDLAMTIARALASAGTPFVIATCKKLEVSNGNFTAIIKSDQDHYNDLISKVQDKGEVVIALYERQFRDGMDDIQSDKDQRSLPLDGEKPASKKKTEQKPKASAEKKIELTPKLIADARDFVTIQQNATFAGLQNQMKIGFDKAEALLKLFEGEGLVKFVGTDQSGQYEIVRAGKADVDVETKDDPDIYGELTYSEVQQVVVLHATEFELSWLSKRFKIDEDRASHLALRLMDDQVIEGLEVTDFESEPKYSVIARLEDLTI